MISLSSLIILKQLSLQYYSLVHVAIHIHSFDNYIILPWLWGKLLIQSYTVIYTDNQRGKYVIQTSV